MDKKIQDMSVVELKALLFDINTKISQLQQYGNSILPILVQKQKAEQPAPTDNQLKMEETDEDIQSNN